MPHSVAVTPTFMPVPLAAWCTARYHPGPLEHWDRGFESHFRHGCMSMFFCVVLSCVDEPLRRAEPPVKEYNQSASKDSQFQKLIVNRNGSDDIILETYSRYL